MIQSLLSRWELIRMYMYLLGSPLQYGRISPIATFQMALFN
jgi:hypothetical protein